MPQSIIVFLRSTFAFFALLALTRTMGKKQLSQLTFFDYVNGITIGSIAASMSVDLGIEAIPSLVGLLTWTLWVVVLGVIDLYNRKWRKIIDGEPTVVIQNGQILENKLKQLNYNLDDLRMQLREKNTFNIADVEFAILEPNGAISVMKKSQLEPLTPSDMNIPTRYKGLPVELIIDGHIVDDNLIQLNLTREWLLQEIMGRKHRLEDIFYAELDTAGNLYIDLRDDLDGIPQEQDITDR